MKVKKITINHSLPKELRKYVRKNSTDLGLDAIDSDGFYSLKKTGSKETQDIVNETVIDRGSVTVIGNKELVCLFIEEYRGNWFRTSPIVSVMVYRRCIMIETENSVYELELQ